MHYTNLRQHIPIYATTQSSIPDKSIWFCFVFKQGLIKLYGIQNKEMYQRIQLETRLYTEEWKKKSMLIGDGSTAIRVFNSKIYHTIIVLKETDPHAEMDMDTHTLSPHTSL